VGSSPRTIALIAERGLLSHTDGRTQPSVIVLGGLSKKNHMKTVFKLGLLCICLVTAGKGWSTTLYSTLPGPTLPDEFSVGYEDSAASEFGALIQLSGAGPYRLSSAAVALSNWGFESLYEPIGASTGFTLPLTLNLYGVGANDTVGSIIDSITVMEFIPWRPEPDPTDCGIGSTDYLASDGGCYPGALSTVSFNLGGVTVPSEFIYGLAFNTQDYGYLPYNAVGPYNSLHFAI
jgi:hypothetical protein